MVEKLLKSAIVVALGVYLGSRLLNGTLEFYIHPRFELLVLLAAVGLLVVGASFFLYERNGHEHEGHSHSSVSWVGLLIVLVPVVLGLLVPPRPLGAAAVGNREIQVGTLSSVAPPTSDNQMGLIRGEKNILDWLADFQRNPDPAIFNGVEADVIGFVYRDDRFGTDEFMVGRFIISCCVADAAPIGLIVQTADAGIWQSDQWVQVKGHFEKGRFGNADMPILIADEIIATEQPRQPYLYP